jgi:FlaA1/EpsC-like NDP-sugar epimerase
MSARTFLRYRIVAVVLVHTLLAAAAWLGAWFLRLDDRLLVADEEFPLRYLVRCLELMPWVVGVRLLTFGWFGLFQGLWRYVSVTDLLNLARALIAGSLLYTLIIVVLGFDNTPRLVLAIEPILCATLVGGIRFVIRTYREAFAPVREGARRVLIVGAGDAGEGVVREMRTHVHMGFNPVGFIDDDVRKQGAKIHGLPVLGRVDEVRAIVAKTLAEEIVVAVPTATGEEYRRILDQCDSTGVRLRRLPRRVADIVRLTELRDVAFEDLLDRDPVAVDLDALRGAISGKVVVVTGAGGSIGSEIVRQVVPLGPSRVVAVDRAESALYFLERDLSVRHPAANVLIRIADCQDRVAIRELFGAVCPDVVIHAAAYKHVPLMEAHPVEAVSNNVAATLALGELSIEHGVERFLLISSDKAVRPTNVMGATKRGAELALQSLEGRGTQFNAVRFGNVLGSDGSVVPLFRKQIRDGGPVTVTHRDVVRFFMTIPEAVGLVLQAGIIGSGGQVFHLDMGQPVRVLELAERLIQLQGFRPYDDVEIRFTGLRPGEKMHEELLIDGEDVRPTVHPRIHALVSGAPDCDRIRARVDDLIAASSHGVEAMMVALGALVPEYRPNNDRFARILAAHRDQPSGHESTT